MYKEFFKLTVPNILTNLTVPLVSVVDVALMGHMGDANYIIAIGLSVAIFNFILWLFGFLRMGTTGQVAQAFGRGDKVAIQQIIFQGILIALVIGLLLIICQSFIVNVVQYSTNVNEKVRLLIEEYFRIRIFAAPASISIFVFNGWLLGRQNSKVALLLALIINSVNVLLSSVLVLYFEMGMAGAAYGTLVAQFTGFILSIAYYFYLHGYKYLYLVKRLFNPEMEWKKFVSINSDLFIRTLCLLFTLTFFKIKAAELEVSLGAANLLLLEFISISAYGIDGLAFAAESISGKYYGQKNLLLLKKSVKVSFQIGLGIAGMGTLVFLLFSDMILSLLTNQQEVIANAQEYLIWVLIAPIVHSIAFIWDGIYIGCTASKQMKWTLLISTILVFLPSYYVFSYYFGNHGVWLSFTLFMVARGGIQTILAKSTILTL